MRVEETDIKQCGRWQDCGGGEGLEDFEVAKCYLAEIFFEPVVSRNYINNEDILSYDQMLISVLLKP